MWNNFIILLLQGLLFTLVNSIQKFDICKIHQKNVSYSCTKRSDSTSIINKDSSNLSKIESKLFKKPIFFKYIRSNREINLKLRTVPEKIFKQKFLLHSKRNAEDNENYITENTTILPLKNTSISNVNVNYTYKMKNELADPVIIAENIVMTEETTISLKSLDYTISTTIYSEESVSKDAFNVSSLLSDDKQIYSSSITTKLESNVEILSDETTTLFHHFDSTDTLPQETSSEIIYNNYDSLGVITNYSITNIDDFSTTVKILPNDQATNKFIHDQQNFISKLTSVSIKTKDLRTNDLLDIIKNENYENNESKSIIANNHNETSNLSNNTTIISNYAKLKNIINSKNFNPKLDKNYNFVVYGQSSIPCILASMNIILKFPYNNDLINTIRRNIEVPITADVNGSCEKENSYMTLAWLENIEFKRKNSITFNFLKDSSFFFVNNIQINIYLNDKFYTNTADIIMAENSTSDLRLFSAKINNGMHVCNSVTEVTCGNIIVFIKDVSLIAYNNKQNISNRKEEYCSTPKNTTITAIVGGVVGISVMIGLITSYIWHRKKMTNFKSELP